MTVSGEPLPPSLELDRVLRTIRRGFALLLLVPLLVGGLVAATSLLTKRRYSATLSASTISGTRGASLGAGLQAALAGASANGLQPTPALITRLARSRQLLVGIARGTSPRSESDLVHLISSRIDSTAPDYRVYQEINRLVDISSDRETGLVTLSVTHPDSALARFLALQIVKGVTRMFREAARTQATELRIGQQKRVDSTASQLATAEEELRRFTAANRYVAPYSEASIMRDRLMRSVSIAQTVYQQVVSDRESAITKELEETPAVIVVDPLPRQLVPTPRNTLLKTVIATAAALFMTLMVLLLRDSRRSDLPHGVPRMRSASAR